MAKVLLVEDDSNLLEIFEMRLKAEGYDTITAQDGEEGIIVAMKEKPDLIVADVMMPKLSGFEMLENLKAAPEMSNLKAVMMTALGQAEDQARGERLGVIKYLVKSQVTLEDFIRVIRGVLPPDQAADDSQAESTTTSPAADKSSNINNQESEQKMPEDPQTTSPAPADLGAPTPPADANPLGAPADDIVGGDQQTSAQEQGAVQDQINSFSPSAPAEPVAPVEEPVAPVEEPVAPVEEPVAPAAEPASDIPVGAPPASDPMAPEVSDAGDASAPIDPTSAAL
jgi:two-component system alkaline phosphatase synthesis response regulator PhoP